MGPGETVRSGSHRIRPTGRSMDDATAAPNRGHGHLLPSFFGRNGADFGVAPACGLTRLTWTGNLVSGSLMRHMSHDLH